MTTPATKEDLLHLSETRFDELRAEQRLFWEPSQPIYLQDNGFQFQFLVVPAFTSKPLPKVEQGLLKSKKDPFGHPEDGFLLDRINETHVLQLNKYCALRPQFLLHPEEFASQDNELDASDFEAAIEVLARLGKPHVCFYNCGAASGASQKYKHMQLIAKEGEGKGQEEFVFWPDKVDARSAENEERIHVPLKSLFVPYAAMAARLSEEGNAEEMLESYQSCLAQLKERLGSSEAHNVVFTKEWISVIPRNTRGRDDLFVNALGMMGMVWLTSDGELEEWKHHGPANMLAHVAFPPLT